MYKYIPIWYAGRHIPDKSVFAIATSVSEVSIRYVKSYEGSNYLFGA